MRDSELWLDDLPSHQWLSYCRRPMPQRPVALLEPLGLVGARPGEQQKVVDQGIDGNPALPQSKKKHAEQTELGV